MSAKFLLEEWKAIPSLPPGYEASSFGRIRSWRRSGRARIKFRMAPLLRQPVPNLRGGYQTMMFVVGGKYVTRYVHHLVLEAFGFVRPSLTAEVRYLNGVNTENNLGNIRWGTHLENIEDQRRHGTLTVGEKNGRAKLTNAIAHGIRTSSEKGYILAQRHQVSEATISRIRHGGRYAD